MSKIVKSGLLIVGFSIVVSFLSYILRFIYSRALSIENFGLFYAGVGLINIFLSYIDLGYSYSVAYFVPKYIKAKKYDVVWNIFQYGQLVQLFTSILVSAILIIIARYISIYYFKHPHTEIFVYFLVSYLIVNSLLNTLYNFYVGLQSEKYYSSLLFMRVILILILSLLVWEYGQISVNNLGAIWTISCFVSLICYGILLKLKFGDIVKNKWNWDKKLFREMSFYALPSVMTVAVYSLINYGDVLILTLLTNIRLVGYYSIILPLAAVPLMFISPLNNLFFPLISGLMEGEREKISILFQKTIQTVPLIALYFSLFMFIFPSSTIAVMFGEKWLGFIENWLGILALGFVLMSLSSIFSTFLVGMGMVKTRLRISIIVAVVSLVLYISLIKFFGIGGAVVANFSVATLSLYLYSRVLRKHICTRVPGTFYLKVGTLFLLAIGIKTLIKIASISVMQFLMIGICYSLVYFSLLFFLKLVDMEYLKSLKTSFVDITRKVKPFA